MFERTIALIGEDNLKKIQSKKVLVIGVGGVGGFSIEALVRSGIKDLTIIDYDTVDITNKNRQIIADDRTIDKYKVDIWKERINNINKEVKVTSIKEKIDENNIELIFKEKYDYIIDCCDTVIVKKLLIKYCHEKNIKLITSCGMGRKKDITKIKICDLFDTSYDPIAKSLRKYVKDNNIKGKIPCVFSEEEPSNNNKEVIASMIFVPSVAGLHAANYVINDILKESN